MSHAGWFLFSFFCGSLPTAYLVARKIKGIDIRSYGSGNSGATNAFRVLGKGPGSFVFAVDLVKGAFPTLLYRFYGAPPWDLGSQDFALWVGFASILGHIFTPFLKFRGGKGVATGAGVLLAGFPGLFFISIAVWTVCFWLTKIVSVSSLVALFSLVAAGLIFKVSWVAFFPFLMAFLLAVWTHRTNLIRLIKAEEPPLKK